MKYWTAIFAIFDSKTARLSLNYAHIQVNKKRVWSLTRCSLSQDIVRQLADRIATRIVYILDSSLATVTTFQFIWIKCSM